MWQRLHALARVDVAVAVCGLTTPVCHALLHLACGCVSLNYNITQNSAHARVDDVVDRLAFNKVGPGTRTHAQQRPQQQHILNKEKRTIDWLYSSMYQHC